MIVRSCSRWRMPSTGTATALRGLGRKATSRRLSTSSPTPTPHTQSSASVLGGVTAELDRLSPRFEIQPQQIGILKGPSEFYEVLKAKISKAQSRVYLSTLYIGKTEHELISCIQDALQRNPNLKVSILTDVLRGTRETPNASCASLLAPLVAQFGAERVEIRMFHTPNLTGLRKRVVPRRINEGWGLQHMKLYGVDDEIIMSGANLSDDYFTNRQDRYHVFSSKEITQYYGRIHDTVSSISYRVLPSDAPGGYTLDWPTTNPCTSPLEDPKAFRTGAAKLLRPLISPSPAKTPPATSTSTTLIYPLFQFTPLLQPDTSTELPAMLHILTSLSTPTLAGASWTFTAGYFNMTPLIRDKLLSTNPTSATVICASPWANGFFGSKGVSGLLPAAYTLLERRFLDAVTRVGLSSQVHLKEWRRGTVNEPGGWTYHAKGLWVTLKGEEDKGPCMSIVGSSNYTKRSYTLDLEANALIVTRDEGLQRRLKEEEQWLQEYAKEVDQDTFIRTDRRVGIQVRVAMWLVKVLGGAL